MAFGNSHIRALGVVADHLDLYKIRSVEHGARSRMSVTREFTVNSSWNRRRPTCNLTHESIMHTIYIFKLVTA